MISLFFIPLILLAGHSLTDWVISWWHWIMPIVPSPETDQTGALVMKYQPTNQPVYFFAGEHNAYAPNRHVTIPQKPIMFPVLITIFAAYGPISEDQLQADAQKFLLTEQPKYWTEHATLDGKPLQLVNITTPVFGMTVPQGTVFSIPPGDALAVSEGFWAFIPALSLGTHNVTFVGGSPNYAAAGVYHILVR